MGILVMAQKTRMLTGMKTVKAMLIRCQREMRSLLGIALEATCLTPWQRIQLHFFFFFA
jgi:hypothetical protein